MWRIVKNFMVVLFEMIACLLLISGVFFCVDAFLPKSATTTFFDSIIELSLGGVVICLGVGFKFLSSRGNVDDSMVSYRQANSL